MCFLPSFCNGGTTTGHGVSVSNYVSPLTDRSCRIKTAELLTAAGIPCTVVLDSAVAYVMEKIDIVVGWCPRRVVMMQN